MYKELKMEIGEPGRGNVQEKLGGTVSKRIWRWPVL